MAVRASKLTPELAAEIFALLARGHYLRSAAAHVGIGKSTLYNWLERGSAARVLADQRPVREQFDSAAAHRTAVAAWRAQAAREKMYLDFADGVELAQDRGEAWLLEQILANALDKDLRNQKWTAFMTVLERTRRERWGRRSSVEHGTPDGKPFPISHVFDPSKLSVEELEQLKLLLERAKPDDQ